MDQLLASFHAECIASEEFLRRLWVYTCATHDEVSALGEVEIRGPQLYIPNILHLLPQERGPGHVEFDIDEVAKFLTQHVRAGKNPERVRLWFHTHVNMSTFWSMTDEDTIKRLANMMPLVVAVVTNQSGEALWRIVQSGQYFVDWKTTLPGKRPMGEELKDAKELIKANTIEPKYQSWLPWRKKDDDIDDYSYLGGHAQHPEQKRTYTPPKEKPIRVQLIHGDVKKALKLRRLTPIEELIEAFHLENCELMISGVKIFKNLRYPLIDGDVINAVDKEPKELIHDTEGTPPGETGAYDFRKEN